MRLDATASGSGRLSGAALRRAARGRAPTRRERSFMLNRKVNARLLSLLIRKGVTGSKLIPEPPAMHLLDPSIAPPHGGIFCVLQVP